MIEIKPFVLYLFLLVSGMVYCQVGINTNNPQETLHINGTFRIDDGKQGTGKILTSDANGTGAWTDPSIKNIIATYGAGVDIDAVEGDYLQTGTTITLPPGTWAVNITMLLVQNPVAITPTDSSVWVRSSFSDSPASPASISSDLVGAETASGNFIGSSTYGFVSGLLIINNSSGADKTYYYIAGNTDAYGYSSTPSYTVDGFGGNVYRENNIIAYRIQ